MKKNKTKWIKVTTNNSDAIGIKPNKNEMVRKQEICRQLDLAFESKGIHTNFQSLIDWYRIGDLRDLYDALYNGKKCSMEIDIENNLLNFYSENLIFKCINL